MADFRVVIPARYASSRFPGKPLAEIAGRSMLSHVHAAALGAGAKEVIVATDDERIAKAASAFGAEVEMTAASHSSGTDRAAEVAARRAWQADDIVVNLQGDAPCTPPSSVGQVAALLEQFSSAAIATLCVPLHELAAFNDVNVVKLVTDQEDRALYFSRCAIPSVGHAAQLVPAQARRHLGIYAYRVSALQRLTSTPPCYLENVEKLEQLRALWLGMEIRVATATEAHGPDVDTPEDIHKAAAFLAAAG